MSRRHLKQAAHIPSQQQEYQLKSDRSHKLHKMPPQAPQHPKPCYTSAP